MEKSDKAFVDSFALGIACGFQKCLDVLLHTLADSSNKSSLQLPGELQNFLKLSAEVLNYFGEKLENEPNIQGFPFRAILEMVASSSEKIFPESGIASEMSAVFEELVQEFRELISHCSEISLRPSDSNKSDTPSEKTSSEKDLSKELCQVVQEMGEIMSQIVDGAKADKITAHSSQRFYLSSHPSENTDLTTVSCSSTNEEEKLMTAYEEDAKDVSGATDIVCANSNDDTIERNDDLEEHNEEEIKGKDGEEICSTCDESRIQVDQEVVERKFVESLLEEETPEQNTCTEEDTEDEVTTETGNETRVLTEDEEVAPEVSKEKELLEQSAIRVFKEHIDRDGLYTEIFRTPCDRPTKHPSYTCRLLEMEAAAHGRSKKAAKRNALCKMIHLVVKKHEEGCLPREIRPFTNEELWALEAVCVGGDDYLSQLRRLCDCEKAPPPVFDVQMSKSSAADKTFTVTCSALGRTAVSTCTRKRSAKRHAARDIVKQYEQQAATTTAVEAAGAKGV